MSRKAKPADEVITAYKGFNLDWSCAPVDGERVQYAVGESVEMDGEAKACKRGFHACEYPLDVLAYYAPATSRYAIVEQSGSLARHGEDSKVASTKLKVKAELSLAGLIKAAIEYTMSRAKPESGSSATGDSGAASATGDSGAASATGYRGAASATGYRGAASATGDSGAASATGDSGAASATGDSGAASATGYRGAASATGDSGAAMACGDSGRVMGGDGCALFLVERDEDYKIVSAWAGIAGRNGIKPLTWYTLRDGAPVEVSP